jgi:2-oxoisovalerate dehydrogenase E1 component
MHSVSEWAEDEVPALRCHRAVGLTDQDVLHLYREMVLARMLDQRLWALNRQGRVPFVISAQGQEGVQVAAGRAIRAGFDIPLPYYRDLGVVIALGMSAREVVLAHLGKPDDPNSAGRQMPGHWGYPELNMVTNSSCVATQLPHACGLALAARSRGDGQVVACFFGDGAASRGDFHEALNFAGIHQLPIVFVCENNGYAISVPIERQAAVPDIARKAESAYRMPGITVDGNDALAVYPVMAEAMQRARSGAGPSLIEAKTYRYQAHTSDDDDRTYRDPMEVELWKKRDPITRMAAYLHSQGLLDELTDKHLHQEVADEVARAVAQADEARAGAPLDAFTHIYAKPLRPLRAPGGLPEGYIDPCPTTPVERYGIARASTSPETPATINVLEAVRRVQDELMAADPRVMILGEDVGRRGGVFRATQGLFEKYGDRLLDTPLAEASIVGIGIGLALAGMRPIVEIQFADFIHAAFDQIVSEAARAFYRSRGAFNVPIVIRAPWGSVPAGAMYHCQAIESFYAHVPGLKVVAPSTPADVIGLMRSAMEDPDPVLFLEHKRTYRAVKGAVPGPDFEVPIGLAEIARPGRDLTIITYGLHRHLSLAAAEQLEAEASIEVVDLRTISPLDAETVLDSARRCGRVLVVHEDNVSFGAGAEVAALVAEEAFFDLDAPVKRLGMADLFSAPFGKGMAEAIEIGVPHIVAAASELLAI